MRTSNPVWEKLFEIEMKGSTKLYPELFKRLLNIWINNALVLDRKSHKKGHLSFELHNPGSPLIDRLQDIL
jgi:hypothetical protein